MSRTKQIPRRHAAKRSLALSPEAIHFIVLASRKRYRHSSVANRILKTRRRVSGGLRPNDALFGQLDPAQCCIEKRQITRSKSLTFCPTTSFGQFRGRLRSLAGAVEITLQ